MKFLETIRYELVYQSRSVSTWFYFVLLLIVSFLMATIVFVDEPLVGSYYLNAPYITTKVSLVTFFFLGLLILAPFAGNAATRDIETSMHPLLYSTPVAKHEYLGGRFLAAFILGSIVMLAIPIGVFTAGLFPLEHAELLGPINLSAYLSTYFLLILPNTFFVMSFMFSVAVMKSKGVISYLIAAIIGVVVIASWQILGSQQANWTIANLTDPLGISIIMELKQIWSANQKNTLLPGMEISVLFNRILWLTISIGMLLITYAKFTTSIISRKDKKTVKWKEATRSAFENHQVYSGTEITIPVVTKSFDLSTRMLQIFSITKESFRLIAFGWGWIALTCMCLFVVLTGSMWFSDYYNIPELPVTGKLLEMLENVKDHGIWFIIPLLIIYYAGELVWRERDARLNNILDSTPIPNWVPFIGKFAGILLALIVMQFFLMMAGILLQISLGYYHFEIPVYLKILFGLRLVDYVLLSVLTFALHVIVSQKYTAHLIAFLFYLFTIFGPEFGIESGLLMYASDPGWSYSTLRGLHPYMLPWLYFKFYWGAWAMLLAVATALLWPRGTERHFHKRFQQGISKTNLSVKVFGGISVLLILAFGGLIHYNTHVLYPKSALIETLEFKAAYEKKYEKYNESAQPSITSIKLQVEIYPNEGSAEFKGTYTLVNRNHLNIDTLFISTAPGVEHYKLQWSQPLKSQVVDEELDFRMCTLTKPLLPGDSLQLEFHINYNPKGFPNNGKNTEVVKNGTYFGNDWLPVIGYHSDREIFDANDRKEHGLEPKSFLESEFESYKQSRVLVDIIIGTDKGQTAVAPGKLLKTWTEKQRNYFHYATENPINYNLGFFSSDYKSYKEQWISDNGKTVDISILHHLDHIQNLERMAKSVQASLTYLSDNFGNYPHTEIRLLEVPGFNKGLYAYPINIFYREGFAVLKPDSDPRGIDIVFATVAHEVSHQWWGAQVSPAPIKGAALITETISWFTAFEIVEENLGKEILLKMLNMARNDYFTPHERAADPLLQASQTKLIYRKGPLALYALREYIGKKQLRFGLQNFFNKYNEVNSPKPVPSDLFKEIQAVTPDSLKYLLNDLLATNTFWELKTEKATTAKVESGKWKVTLDVVARKFTIDQNGTESDVKMNDWIEVGIYCKEDGKKERKAIYLKQHLLHSGKQTIEILLTQKPDMAGIDTNQLLLDLNPNDNIISIK